MRAWYSPIATVELYFVWSVVFLVGLMTVMLMAPSKSQDRPGLPFREAIHNVGIVLLGMAGTALVIWAVYRLRGRFFPRVAFAIGHGASRYAVDEAVRWSVCVAFIVGIASSIAYSFF